MKTYYDILGVKRGDSPEAIRVAYIGLMKRHHPDAQVSRATRVAAEAEVTAINEAFATLKDPRKRARYDAELGLAEKKRAQAPPRSHAAAAGAASAGVRRNQTLRPAPPVAMAAPPRRRRRLRPVRAFAALLFLAGAGAGAVYAYQRLAERESAYGAQVVDAGSAMPLPPELPQVLVVDVRDAVSDAQWIVSYGSAGEAVRYSRHCWTQLTEFPNLRFFDRCVAFDLVWQSKLENGSAEPAGDYFVPATVASRHRTYLARISDAEIENEARLTLLDRLTVSEIARTLSTA